MTLSPVKEEMEEADVQNDLDLITIRLPRNAPTKHSSQPDLNRDADGEVRVPDSSSQHSYRSVSSHSRAKGHERDSRQDLRDLNYTHVYNRHHTNNRANGHCRYVTYDDNHPLTETDDWRYRRHEKRRDFLDDDEIYWIDRNSNNNSNNTKKQYKKDVPTKPRKTKVSLRY